MRTEESCWLIERKLNGGSLYIGRKGALVTAINAIRFSRRIDAQMTLGLLQAFTVLPQAEYVIGHHLFIGIVK